MKMNEIISIRLTKESAKRRAEEMPFLNQRKLIRLAEQINSYFALSEFAVRYGHYSEIKDRLTGARNSNSDSLSD